MPFPKIIYGDIPFLIAPSIIVFQWLFLQVTYLFSWHHSTKLAFFKHLVPQPKIHTNKNRFWNINLSEGQKSQRNGLLWRAHFRLIKCIHVTTLYKAVSFRNGACIWSTSTYLVPQITSRHWSPVKMAYVIYEIHIGPLLFVVPFLDKVFGCNACQRLGTACIHNYFH